jgi:predicted O-methyltransferase YrrM
MKRRTHRPSLDLLIGKKDLVGAEIGVQNGYNAEWILKNLDIEKLYLIDPYSEYPSNNPKQTIVGPFPEYKEEALRVLDSYKDKIEWVGKYSWDALDMFENRSLDFVYIDGDHRGKAIYKDLQYIKKIKYEGLLCGHDWRFTSVKSALQKFATDSRLKFNCCNSEQYVQTIGNHADNCDWWIPCDPGMDLQTA